MINNYNDFLNEKLTDKLSGYSYDELMKKLNLYALPPNEMLEKCAYYGILQGMQLALDNGADIHSNKEKALHNAIEKKHYNAVVFLIENGADIHIDNDYLLDFAIRSNDVDIVKLLLNKGIDINKDPEIALAIAIDEPSAKVVKYFLYELKLKITKNLGKLIDKDQVMRYFIFGLIYQEDDNNDIKTAVNTYEPNDLLIYGLKNDNIEIVKLAFEKGAEIVSHAVTFLLSMLSNDKFEMIEYLISKGLVIKKEYLTYLKNQQTILSLKKYVK